MKRNVLVGSIAILLIAAAVIVTVILLSGTPSLNNTAWELERIVSGGNTITATIPNPEADQPGHVSGTDVGAPIPNPAFTETQIIFRNSSDDGRQFTRDIGGTTETVMWDRTGNTLEIYRIAVEADVRPESATGAGDAIALGDRIILERWTINTHNSENLVMTMTHEHTNLVLKQIPTADRPTLHFTSVDMPSND
ncbi:MAG: hypothetical protein FWE01_02415 [Firmicutes bacterium]|nr:hypothetical protein [Bacillota bacterium]